MANRLYNKQVTPKGYKRGGGVTGEKKPGIIRKAIGKVIRLLRLAIVI